MGTFSTVTSGMSPIVLFVGASVPDKFEITNGNAIELTQEKLCHDDVIKWKHFPRYWPFVRGIHRSPVNFPHKGQ